MSEDIRRVVAFAASGRINKTFGSRIYSYARSEFANMSERFDYASGSHLGGMSRGNIFHYGKGCHIKLDVEGQSFKAFDYGTGTHFAGKIQGRRVQVFDYAEGKHFTYQI